MTIRTRLTRPRTRWLAPLFGLAVAIAVGFALAQVGSAEARGALIQEEPQRGSVVADVPKQLVLTFNRPLVQVIGAHRVEVTDSTGARVDDGQAMISNYSQRTLIVPISAKGDGGLHVDYSVLLIGEGESLRASSAYEFTIDHTIEDAGGEEIAAPATTKAPQPIVLWTVAILLGIAAVGAMAYFLRLATGTSRSSLDPTNRSVFRD